MMSLRPSLGHTFLFCRFSSSARSSYPRKTASLLDRTIHRSFSYKVAIVGSGPSGFYTAKYLQSSLEKKGVTDNQIDILERLPTPYGLVRYGVAPDHPEVKNVQNDFSALVGSNKGIRFFGNVQVGRDVSVQELRERYDAVVLAYGCESDRKLGLPGEDSLSGILSAREFVAWYNGHPNYVHIGEQVSKAFGSSQKDGIRDVEVVVVGQGNVALDCARILAKGAPGLFDTDIASHTLPVLGGGVSRVTVVGRRGHVQGAFTIKELRELTKLESEGFGTSFIVLEDELELGATEASLAELSGPGGRSKGRIDKLLRSVATTDDGVPSSPKEVHLRFLLNPIKFEASDVDGSSLGSITCERTTLEGEPGQQRAVGSGTYETFAAQLALVSIGYKGIVLPGMEQYFDERPGVVLNEHGRIDGASKQLAGLYTSGWLKRGPSGIIGTNISDAKETVATIVRDLDSAGSNDGAASGDLESLLNERSVDVVRWEDYLRIEDEERRSRRSDIQPREKIVDLEGLMKAAYSK